MKNNFGRRWLVVGAVFGAVVCLTSCAGADERATETPVSVATRAATVESPTPATSVATPTLAATPSPVASPSPSPTVADAATATAPAPNPGGGSTSVPQPTAAPRASAVALTFRAANLAFDKTAVRVPVGATITATLQNDDIGQEHNLTFGLPGLPHGESCKGPCTATQVFKVETAGSYSFLCTIHDMFGTFIVDP